MYETFLFNILGYNSLNSSPEVISGIALGVSLNKRLIFKSLILCDIHTMLKMPKWPLTGKKGSHLCNNIFYTWYFFLTLIIPCQYLHVCLLMCLHVQLYIVSFIFALWNTGSVFTVNHQMLLWAAVAVSPRWVASHPAARRRPPLESLQTHTAPPHRRLWHPRVPRRRTSHQGSC